MCCIQPLVREGSAVEGLPQIAGSRSEFRRVHPAPSLRAQDWQRRPSVMVEGCRQGRAFTGHGGGLATNTSFGWVLSFRLDRDSFHGRQTPQKSFKVKRLLR